MILVLTYHKVCGAEANREREFYTVSRDSFVAQIKAVLQAGYHEVHSEDLLEGRNANGARAAKFLLTFDDGTADHYEIVFPVLKELGLRGIFFVPTVRLNRPGYLTDAQVREISQAGQAIGFHGHEHVRLDRATDDQMRNQFQLARDSITRLTGTAPLFFAPPGGFMSEHLREVAMGFGVEAIRTMHWGFNRHPDRTALETVPVHRHLSKPQFQKILEGKQPSRLLYLGKQAAKAFVPARAYERLRGLFFKFARKP